MRLWTIQDVAFVGTAVSTGVAEASWARVQDGWRGAYAWMTRAMVRRRRAPTGWGGPPVWAWRACGPRRGAPSRDAVEAMLGEAANDPRWRMVTLRARPGEVLLSRYGPWCELLERSPRAPSRAPRGLWQTARRAGGWRGNYDDIQACLVAIRRDDIVSVESLAAWCARADRRGRR